MLPRIGRIQAWDWNRRFLVPRFSSDPLEEVSNMRGVRGPIRAFNSQALSSRRRVTFKVSVPKRCRAGMNCLHCGQALNLLQKLKQEKFCNKSHERAYVDQRDRLAVERLVAARSSTVVRTVAPASMPAAKKAKSIPIPALKPAPPKPAPPKPAPANVAQGKSAAPPKASPAPPKASPLPPKTSPPPRPIITEPPLGTYRRQALPDFLDMKRKRFQHRWTPFIGGTLFQPLHDTLDSALPACALTMIPAVVEEPETASDYLEDDLNPPVPEFLFAMEAVSQEVLAPVENNEPQAPIQKNEAQAVEAISPVVAAPLAVATPKIAVPDPPRAGPVPIPTFEANSTGARTRRGGYGRLPIRWRRATWPKHQTTSPSRTGTIRMAGARLGDLWTELAGILSAAPRLASSVQRGSLSPVFFGQIVIPFPDGVKHRSVCGEFECNESPQITPPVKRMARIDALFSWRLELAKTSVALRQTAAPGFRAIPKVLVLDALPGGADLAPAPLQPAFPVALQSRPEYRIAEAVHAVRDSGVSPAPSGLRLSRIPGAGSRSMEALPVAPAPLQGSKAVPLPLSIAPDRDGRGAIKLMRRARSRFPIAIVPLSSMAAVAYPDLLPASAVRLPQPAMRANKQAREFWLEPQDSADSKQILLSRKAG